MKPQRNNTTPPTIVAVTRYFEFIAFHFPFLKLQIVQLGSLDVRTKDNTEKTIPEIRARTPTAR
jgi:hypothetical protein